MSETSRFTPAQLRARATWHENLPTRNTGDALTAEYLRYAADVLEAQAQLEQELLVQRAAVDTYCTRWEEAEAKLAALLAGEPERTP